MTKERLEAYRNNKTEILSLDYILNNRWQSETMLGNDVILDYSKGYPMPQSIVGFDQEKYERLQERDLKRKERLEKEKHLQEAMLRVKSKYGKNAILKAADLQEGATTIDRNRQIGGHKA